MTIPDRHATVYPGHPVTIATFILLKYKDDFEAALAPVGEHEFLRALTDSDIPGAGGCVHQALDLLRKVRKGHLSPEEALEEGKEMWVRRCKGGDHPKNLDAGNQEAEEISEDFLRLTQGFRAPRPEVLGEAPETGLRVVSAMVTQGGRVLRSWPGKG